MNAMTEHGLLRPRRILVVLGFAGLCALVIAVGATSQPADGARAKTLGKTKSTPRPNCPTPKRYRGDRAPDPPLRKSCQVLGSVTGFQTRGGGKKGLFEVPRTGWIVAWSVKLSKPTKDERAFFGRELGTERLGKDPTARLAVLRPQGNKRYKLMKTTPVMRLNPYLGETPVFTLNKPLRVKRGRIIALTTPTWVSDFSAGRGRQGDAWRASRQSGRCEGSRNLLERSKPHQKVGSSRRYGCKYTNARMLYWAYWRPN
jgi:hypothetical protein